MKESSKKKRNRRPLYPCPKCGERTCVEDAKRKKGYSFPHRYRTCLNCEFHFKTEEKIVIDE